jgi:hypothetical protein
MTHCADPHVALKAALERLLSAHGIDAEFLNSDTQPWASGTFIGVLHRFFYASASSVRSLTRRIGKIEFDLPGHVVIEITLSKRGDAFFVQALTVQEF